MNHMTVNQSHNIGLEQIGDKIRKFIYDNFLFGASEKAFEDDDSFLEGGIIDSTGILEIVSFIEEEYRLHVEDDEIVPENLDSVNRISCYIRRKVTA